LNRGFLYVWNPINASFVLTDQPVGYHYHRLKVKIMRVATLTVLLALFGSSVLFGQGSGSITGVVRDSVADRPLYGLTVAVIEVNRLTSTNEDGTFSFDRIEAGTYTVRVSGVGWNPVSHTVTVADGGEATATFLMVESAKNMGEVIVYGASRAPEKLTSAPAAISVVTPLQIEQAASHGSVGKTMENIVGVDVVQNGANDYNINSRGFNNSINRRMLVQIDGRDPSTPLINLNEWNSLTSLLGDIQSIEVVRGPGSALYGANAYNGVVNIRTTDPKDVLGTRVNLVAGEWETYKGSIRHAGEFGDFAYKVNVGYRQQLNYSVVSRQDSVEYPGLAPDVFPLKDEFRRPYAFVATGRLDYYFDQQARMVLEGGYSNSGNEFYVNQTGRILIKEVARPFTRLAYNSENINVQALWQRRVAPQAQLVYNAKATSGEESDVFSIDAQWNDTFLNDKLRLIVGAQHEQQFVNTTYDYDIAFVQELDSNVGRLPLLDPDDQRGIFTGVYAQAEYQIADPLKIVGAIRFDDTNFDFPLQISPKAALVYEPIMGQTFRFTYNRSWLRPSFADFFRKSPAGRPVPGASIERQVDSLTRLETGKDNLSSNLGMTESTPVWNLGNPTLGPETAQSFELGYRGTALKRLFVEVNAYWNRRSDLISNPLGGLAPSVYEPVRSSSNDADFDAVANRKLDSLLGTYGRSVSQLSEYQNNPALVVVPTNIAIVDEYGLEISATYFLTNELSIGANYSYLNVQVQDNEIEANKILPNTSPQRFNVSLEYDKPGVFDAHVNLRYVEGFDWIAGLIEGHVPAYAVMNLSAGYYVLPDLRVGINAFNLLDRRHYQIFGGTILRREVTGSVTYSF